MSNKMKNMRAALLFCLVAVISLSVSAQNVTVTGTVTDKTGETVIGASVVQKGNTSNGTITDIDGNFSLSVPANSTLVFSYVGMTSQEIPLKGKTKVEVVMEDDAQALEEVVVIGYGSVKRKDLTGSVATVNSEVLAAVPVASATEALQGKMAGVQITTTEGSPDAEMKIRVRGGGSITGDNTPLFIVDGFPVESISDIPASDIEDMTVLKDASSTAIYGSRGANGVILVTTKSGKEGKLSVSYNAYYSWKKMAKTLNTLSATDYVKWQREYALLRDNESKFTSLFGNWQDADLYENAPTNDWQDQVFGRTGNTFNHNLTISGGSDKTKFNMGYAHMNDKAIMLGSSFRRDNLSLKLNHKVNDKVSLDFSMRYANTTVNGAGAKENIKERCDQIKAQIAATKSDYDREKLQERLAKLSGGVAVLYVGAASEVEMKEKKDRVDDALRATRAAIEEGIVAGGGVAYIRAIESLDGLKGENDDETTGIAIIKRAIEEPLRQIVANAGKEGAVVVQKVSEGKGDFGYNARTDVYENMHAAGVVDPAKVTRVALENAASIAGMFLTTECVIVEKKEDKPEMPMGAPGMGGMGGMM